MIYRPPFQPNPIYCIALVVTGVLLAKPAEKLLQIIADKISSKDKKTAQD
jgi:hypothetical protein